MLRIARETARSAWHARTLLRQPAFALTAVLALALGIGANTAVFSVVYAVLLKPLPFPDPEQLVYVHDTYAAVPSASVSFPKFVALRDHNQSLQAIAALTPGSATLTGAGEPEQVLATRVTVDFFKVLDVKPLRGRWFSPDEDSTGGPPAIMLSYGLWQRRYGGNPDVVGEAIAVNGRPHTVVGVMPPSFAYPSTAAAWIPLARSAVTTDGGNFLRIVGRARPGVGVEQRVARWSSSRWRLRSCWSSARA